MPMAALLSRRIPGRPPSDVIVVQRNSPTSGWKVDAINAGRSPIGGVEPELDRIVAESAAAGSLRATHDFDAAGDAEAILVCVQTDRRGLEPDYGPLMDALQGVVDALVRRSRGVPPLVIIESTLAPTTMQTVIRPFFARHGLVDGRDVLLGNSPNRVMPGRLVERITRADKLAAGLTPRAADGIAALYGRIVTEGRVLATNSLTAEIVKTLENAFRDVRIAYTAEVARYCDDADIDFFVLRDRVNTVLAASDGASWNATAVPTGALLVPTVGVGGHCLPKDGILLWWRALQHGWSARESLILSAREVNDESPAVTVSLAGIADASWPGRQTAVLGAAYRFDSEDTRNSPSLALAALLRHRGAVVTVHDPYVHRRDANLARLGLTSRFTGDLDSALGSAETVFLATGHGVYRQALPHLRRGRPADTVVDACNLFAHSDFEGSPVRYAGIGRGRRKPDATLVSAVGALYRAVARGVANEVDRLAGFFNDRYSSDAFNRTSMDEIRRLAATCTTGCDLPEPGDVEWPTAPAGFASRLARLAAERAPVND
jgi:UDP-N-acetyl-D-mannosaminuronic acid dehydrogenase